MSRAARSVLTCETRAAYEVGGQVAGAVMCDSVVTAVMTTERDLQPPLLESYEYARRIAVGGMAEIFLAWQKGPGGFRRQVAIKHALPQLTSDPEFVSLFLREAHIASDLSHPNIVSVLDVLNPEGKQCLIVMEYVHGPTLRGLLRAAGKEQVPIPLEVTTYIITSLCAALDYAYNTAGIGGRPRHIVHRDVTPTNILLSREGQVKLGDFGIARTYTAESVTRTGVVRGKAAYMSPEQTRGEPLDQASDVFSVGVLLYEMVTGVQPFHRPGSEAATVQAVLSDPLPDPTVHAADLSAGLLRVIHRALARDKDQRYGSAKELATDLKRAGGTAANPAAMLSELIQKLIPDNSSKDDLVREDREDREGSSGARTTVVVTKSRRTLAKTNPPSPGPIAPVTAAATPGEARPTSGLTVFLFAIAFISAVAWAIVILKSR